MFPPESVLQNIRINLPEIFSGDTPALTPMQGNCHPAAKIKTENGAYFIKWNSLGSSGDYFAAEEKGISKIGKHCSLPSPQIILRSTTEDGYTFLLLQWIDAGYDSELAWEKLGVGIAELHKNSSKHFGMDHDNYIGLLPQCNEKNTSWSEFFYTQRLEKQLEAISKKGTDISFLTKKINALSYKLTEIFPPEKPALIHGDLWTGNVIANAAEQPYLIDPSIYYAHREMEIAFTTLFGGFGWKFYGAYNENFPLEKGFESRENVYHIYPLLVHLNMFGGRYYDMLKTILAKY